MPWVFLFFAGLCEVLWAVAMKYADGFTRLTPTLVTIAGSILSFILLAQAMKSLPLSTAYAVWTGIGTIGTVLIGVLALGEHLSLLQGVCLLCILIGVIGMRLLST
jgi:quaternary ammonium compound-resistance protein SugE